MAVKLSDLLRSIADNIRSLTKTEDKIGISAMGTLLEQASITKKYLSDIVSTRLSDLNKSHFAGITSIGAEAFRASQGLETLYIPENVLNICNGAFRLCPYIHKVEVHSKNIETNAFAGCVSLSEIVIGDEVENISNKNFTGYYIIESLTIGAKVKRILSNVFISTSGVARVENIFIKNETPPTIDITFDDDILISITVPKGSAEKYTSADGWSNYESKIKEVE